MIDYQVLEAKGNELIDYQVLEVKGNELIDYQVLEAKAKANEMINSSAGS